MALAPQIQMSVSCNATSTLPRIYTGRLAELIATALGLRINLKVSGYPDFEKNKNMSDDIRRLTEDS